MRVLVCGTKNADPRVIEDALDQFHQTAPITCLIHNGQIADLPASKWAFAMDVETFSNPLLAKTNRRMWDKLFFEGRPRALIAFPGDRTTADIIGRARAEGLDVYIIRVKYSPDLAPSDWEVEQ